jgi:predicted hydrocarbon binding protein
MTRNNNVITSKYKVSGLYLRGVLSGLRKISGQKYESLLEQAGLSQFSQKYPAHTLETVATGTQLIRLLELIIDLVGADVFNLLYTNLGRGFGQALATFPQFHEIAQSDEYATFQMKLNHLLESIAELHNQALGGKIETKIEAEPNTFRLIFHDCFYCLHTQKATKPACVNVPAMYKQVLLELTKLRFNVEEVKCGAVTGEPDCHFILKYNPIAN